jgi:protein-disulfide isomerase
MMSVLTTSPRLTVPLNERDHVIGPETAPVTVVEYGDYECPYCGAAYPVTKALQQRLGENLRFAYRHFPLSQIHPHSYQAAEAAEAAGVQDSFWEMHDMLFEHQARLSTQDLLAYAGALGLELERVGGSRRASACAEDSRRLLQRRPERRQRHADVFYQRRPSRRWLRSGVDAGGGSAVTLT